MPPFASGPGGFDRIPEDGMPWLTRSPGGGNGGNGPWYSMMPADPPRGRTGHSFEPGGAGGGSNAFPALPREWSAAPEHGMPRGAGGGTIGYEEWNMPPYNGDVNRYFADISRRRG